MSFSMSRRDALLAAALGLPLGLTACSSDGGQAVDGVQLDGDDNIRVGIGQPVRHQLKAVGGKPPYKWDMVTGSAPGVSLASGGLLSGTFTRPGTWDLVVKATDSTGQASGPIALTLGASRGGGITSDVVAIGTSLTARLTQDGHNLNVPWVDQWQRLFGFSGVNLAGAGKSSVQMASRIGAIPWRTVSEVRVPGSGGVDVPLAWDYSGKRVSATFGDIPGYSTYRPFERNSTPMACTFHPNSGHAKVMPAGSPLQIHRDDVNYAKRLVVVELSRNDFAGQSGDKNLPEVYRSMLGSVEKCVERHRLVVETLTAKAKDAHVVVVGQPASATDSPDRISLGKECNAALEEAFPDSYADCWAWLGSPEAFTAVGKKMTDQDKRDAEKGVVPKSLRLDLLHPTTDGHTALAHFYWNLMHERGWR